MPVRTGESHRISKATKNELQKKRLGKKKEEKVKSLTLSYCKGSLLPFLRGEREKKGQDLRLKGRKKEA